LFTLLGVVTGNVVTPDIAESVTQAGVLILGVLGILVNERK